MQTENIILLKIPTGGRQISWLFTKHGLGAGLEHGGLQITHPAPLTTRPHHLPQHNILCVLCYKFLVLIHIKEIRIHSVDLASTSHKQLKVKVTIF